MEDERIISQMARKAWREHYHELGIYKLIVRRKVFIRWWVVFAVFVAALKICTGHEFTTSGKWVFVSQWGFLILVAFAGAIDHFYIGTRIKKILRELESGGVFISKKELMFYVRDIIR